MSNLHIYCQYTNRNSYRYAIFPVAAVEVEFSLFETGILRNSVAATCASLQIPIVAYSPLGKGILTGNVMNPADIPENLRLLDKLQGDNLEQNLRLVQALHKLSEEYPPYNLPQLAMSWVRSLSCRNRLPVIIPIFGSSREQNIRANAIDVGLTEDDLKRLEAILEKNKVVGNRSYGAQMKYIEG